MVRVPGVDTRRKVLGVALELFLTQGYDRTSLREIADRLGFTKAALYYHFRAKEDIIHALAGDFMTELEQLFDRARADQATGPQAHTRLMHDLLDVLLDNREIAVFISCECKALIPSAFGERAMGIFTTMSELLMPPSPTTEERARVLAAIGIVQSTVFHMPDVEADELRRLILPLALSALEARDDELPAQDVRSTSDVRLASGDTVIVR